MGGIDKLDADLGGRSVLRRAVESMAAARAVGGLVVVAAPDRAAELAESSWLESLGGRVVEGGPRRQDSVAAGVRATSAEVVLVHDGARPFVRSDVVDAVADAARDQGAAIPVLPVVDSLKSVRDGSITSAPSREGLFRAQTPQGARRELLLAAIDAHARKDDSFGDEAELLARHGVAVATVMGDPANLKVTVPADLDLLRAVAGAPTRAQRTGIGTDTHPFGPEMGLHIGGIELADAPRLFGHSDGDVVLHAIADALLGAAGLGDLGRAFPSSDPSTTGIASTSLLVDVIERVRDEGWRPTSIDVTIVGSRPRLGGARLDAMRDAIARIAGMEPSQVSVKASSGNLSGDEGAGRVISATAIAGLVRA